MDFIRTIGDDDEVPDESDDSSSDEEAVAPKGFPSNKKIGHSAFNKAFQFTERGIAKERAEFTDGLDEFVRRPQRMSLEGRIQEIRAKRRKLEAEAKMDEETPGGVGTTDSNDPTAEQEEVAAADGGSSSEEDVHEEVGVTDLNNQWDSVKNKALSEKRIKRMMKDGPGEVVEEKPFFEVISGDGDDITNFEQMNLSRPLLKAVAAMNFSTPTPIQAMTIPVALLGKDICACAATGTGKTAAFMLPTLERLLYKPRQAPVSRVLVLVPTRELGVQVFQVTKQLGQFTGVQVSLAVGGLAVKLQEAALRKGPDIIIATPGRLIDHLHNAPSFGLDTIEVLILDEADRMLDEYFAEQMKEIIRMCSVTRQTMLFSATMTDEVKDLALVSLKDPVKIFVNENTEVAYNLRQEFIRIRNHKEGDREAIVAALCCRTFHDHCLVFVQTKRAAHRLFVVLGLLGLQVGELHGNLTQPKRLESLRRFKEAQIDILVATDLAARGLDIEGVKTVINLTMPNTLKHYVHRVGRTARAGKGGRSVSLIGESERKMLKEIIKEAKTAVKSRTVPREVVQKYRDKITSLEEDIKTVFRLEWEDKQINIQEKTIHKAELILQHQDEIMSRPKRNWFQTHKERLKKDADMRLDKGFPKREKRGRNARKKAEETADDRVEDQLRKSQLYAARAAKRTRKGVQRRPNPRGSQEPKDGNQLWITQMSKKLKDQERIKKLKQRKSSFATEMTRPGGKSVLGDKKQRPSRVRKQEEFEQRKARSNQKSGKKKR